MGKVVFDSSFLIALIDKDHEAHKGAIDFLSKCEDIPVGNPFIFLEVLHCFGSKIKNK